MKLLFLGPPRTATKSLWDALSKHESIAGSIIKEPLNNSLNRHLYPYDKDFHINDKTKYLLDGTPFPYRYKKEIIRGLSDKKKILYIMRNPYDRIYSTIKQQIITYSKEKNSPIYHKPKYIKSDSCIIEDLKLIRFYRDSKSIKDAFDITNDVLLMRFDEIDFNTIFNFLDIEPMDIEMEHLNKMEIWDSDIYRKVRTQVDAFWERKKKEISEIILEDLYKIRKMINVEDWIEEANHTLSNV